MKYKYKVHARTFALFLSSSSLAPILIIQTDLFNKMSNPVERDAEDRYERDNDKSPVTGSIADNSYANETNPNLRAKVPVQRDEQEFDDPMQPPYSNSDQQLGKFSSLALSPLDEDIGN